jgi:hypothetical protein
MPSTGWAGLTRPQAKARNHGSCIGLVIGITLGYTLFERTFEFTRPRQDYGESSRNSSRQAAAPCSDAL